MRDPTLIPSSTAVDLLPVYNPASGTLVAKVENMGRAETQEAIQQAKAVGKDWAATLTKDRSTILETWYALMMEHTEDLATIMTAECGKPLAESRSEVAYAASFLK